MPHTPRSIPSVAAVLAYELARKVSDLVQLWFKPFKAYLSRRPMPSKAARRARARWAPLPVPPRQGAWLARLQRTAEELGIIPAGLKELEFNVTPTRILTAEYWSGFPRTEANHTVVAIPDVHQSTFDDFAVEFQELLKRSG